MPTDHRDWYDTPLYYDIIFDADTPREATFLETVWTIFGEKSRTRRVLVTERHRLVFQSVRPPAPSKKSGDALCAFTRTPGRSATSQISFHPYPTKRSPQTEKLR